jgi:hypothetical protein
MRTFLLLGLSLVLSGCSGDWTGYLYPDRLDLANYATLGHFESLEQCRASARSVLFTTHTGGGDYECGLNCRNKDGLNTCDRTER